MPTKRGFSILNPLRFSRRISIILTQYPLLIRKLAKCSKESGTCGLGELYFPGKTNKTSLVLSNLDKTSLFSLVSIILSFLVTNIAYEDIDLVVGIMQSGIGWSQKSFG